MIAKISPADNGSDNRLPSAEGVFWVGQHGDQTIRKVVPKTGAMNLAREISMRMPAVRHKTLAVNGTNRFYRSADPKNECNEALVVSVLDWARNWSGSRTFTAVIQAAS